MKSFTPATVAFALVALVAAQSSSSTSSSTVAEPTEVNDCHLHGDTPFCFATNGKEWEVEDVDEDDLADAYTDCHLHGTDELHCSSPEEVTLAAAGAEDEEAHDDDDHDHEHSSTSNSNSTLTATADITEVTGCHAHDDSIFCFVGSNQWEVEGDVDADDAPDAYTDCHAHGEELHCESPQDVTLAATTDHSEEHEDGEQDHTHTTTSSGETSTESQTAGNLASATEISGALIMLGAAVAALCAF